MKFLNKYRAIIAAYKAGEYGSEHMSVYEILCAASEPSLLRDMSVSELKTLQAESSGVVRSMFSILIRDREAELVKLETLERESQTIGVRELCAEGDLDASVSDRLNLKLMFLESQDMPDDTEAILCPSDDVAYKGIIKIARDDKTKFQYIHEILHYLRDVGIGQRVTRVFARKKQGKTSSAEEQELNYLTAATVMPFEKITAYLNDFETTDDLGERKLIETLSAKFEQQPSAVRRRIIEVRSLVDYGFAL